MPRTSDSQRHAATPESHDMTSALLMDDWGDFFDAPAADLVFECSLDAGSSHAGVSVFTDRVEVRTDDSVVPTVHELEQITSWSVRADDAGTATIDVDGPVHSRTHLPRAFSAALTVALQETLRDIPRPASAGNG
jgi:hypothetical protein